MFKALAQLLDRTPTEERKPFLKDSELAALRVLLREDGWPVLHKLIERRVQQIGEEMLVTPDIDRLLHLRGQVLGLREAATLVDKALRQGEDFDAYKRRTEGSGGRAARAVATYGTEFWST